MGTQYFTLNHVTYQQEVFRNFQQLLQDEKLVDATLVCEGISIKAHKVILSGSSPFFQKLFLENPCNHPIVIMKNVKYKSMKGIVDLMYHGRIVDFSMSTDEFSELLETADMLNIKGLLELASTSNFHLNIQNAEQEQISKDSSNSVQHPTPYHHTHRFASEQEQGTHITEDSAASDFMIGDVSNVSSEPEIISAEVKQEPDSNHVSRETSVNHFTSEDTVSSECYEGTFVYQRGMKENDGNSNITNDENVKLTPTCQQESPMEEAMPQFSDIIDQYGKLPSGQNNSAESLGVIMKESLPPLLHYASLEHSSLSDHHNYTFNQGTAPITDLKLHSEPNTSSVSNQSHPGYVLRAVGELEENERNEEGNGLVQRKVRIVSSGQDAATYVGGQAQKLGVELESQVVSGSCLDRSDKSLHKFAANSNKTILVASGKSNKVVQQYPDRLSSCDVCGREFSTPFALARHKAVHTGERPFVCEVCGKRFARNDNFRVHQTIHTGAQPHTCSICKRKFITTSHLREHMYTHLTSRNARK